MLCTEGVLCGVGMPCPDDPSRPADNLKLGDRLEDVILGVYAPVTIDAETDRGEVCRCILPDAYASPLEP